MQDLYYKQLHFQRVVLNGQKQAHVASELPKDNLSWFNYHVLAMVEEMGEVMKSDKRWKTHRNERYEPNEKLDEIADVFITAFNMAIFSGIKPDALYAAINSKIDVNLLKAEKAKESEKW